MKHISEDIYCIDTTTGPEYDKISCFSNFGFLESYYVVNPGKYEADKLGFSESPLNHYLKKHFENRSYIYLRDLLTGILNSKSEVNKIYKENSKKDSDDFFIPETCTIDDTTYDATYPEYDNIFVGDPDIDLQTIFDALLFACDMITAANGGMGKYTQLPEIEEPSDLIAVANYFDNIADRIRRTAAKIVFQDIPNPVFDTIKKGGVEYLYPGYKGEHLEEINNLMVQFNNLHRLANSLADMTNSVSTQIKMTKNRIEILETQEEINHLQAMKEILDRTQQILLAAIDIMASAGMKTLWSQGESAAAAAKAAVVMAIQTINIELTAKIEELQRIQIQYETRNALIELYSNLSSINLSMQDLILDLYDTFYAITNTINKIVALEIEASQLLEKIGFGTDNRTERVFHVNTVMRMRYNTLLKRYQNAFSRAKKLAYIARRAIEYRFGVNLSEINNQMMLVPPPSTWADDVCNMQGMDYSKIRQEIPEISDYASSYIGDYVQKLEDFVESYPMDFPFMDADDFTVISLKNDYFHSTIPCEELEESNNLLYYSEDLNSSHQEINEETGEVIRTYGWQKDNSLCGSTQPFLEVWENDTPCVNNSDCLNYFGTFYRRADRIQDVVDGCNKGFIYQILPSMERGSYILAWRDLFLDLDDSRNPVPYRVEVKKVTDSEEESLEIFNYSGEVIIENQWNQHFIIFTLNSQADIKIEIHPSDSDESGVYGDVYLTAFQLNAFDTDDYLRPESEIIPKSYQKTDHDRMRAITTCPDINGYSFRRNFVRVCPPDRITDADCYYEIHFDINFSDIESGRYFTSGIVSTDNFNYRHKRIAVNFVGTNIRDCTAEGATQSCYANGFIPYTLIHSGTANIRNYEYQYESFRTVPGKINRGKGLSTESVITNPPTSNQLTLIEPYWNGEFRGRPLEGHYTLRIYNIPELQWSNVEDIQLILDYHYWTKLNY